MTRHRSARVSHVPLTPDARYLGAWGELNARLQMRDQALWNLITACFVLMGLVVGTAEQLDRPRLYAWLAAIPWLTVVMSFTLLHHDHIVTALVRCMREVTRRHDDTRTGWFWPDYAPYGDAVRARLWFHLGHTVSVLVFSTIAVTAAWPHRTRVPGLTLLLALATLAVVVVLVLSWSVYLHRRRLLSDRSAAPTELTP
jgi:hypothetical protein